MLGEDLADLGDAVFCGMQDIGFDSGLESVEENLEVVNAGVEDGDLAVGGVEILIDILLDLQWVFLFLAMTIFESNLPSTQTSIELYSLILV